MQDLGRITTRIKLVGGLNALCWAAAGFITTTTVIKIDNWKNKVNDRKQFKEAVKTFNDFVDKLTVKNKESKSESSDSDCNKDVFRADDLIFDNPNDAKDVLTQMCNIIDQTGNVTIQDFMELSGAVCNYNGDISKYGWTELNSDVEVCLHPKHTACYYIKLPLPTKL